MSRNSAPWPNVIQGPIVEEFHEFGHHFQIEKLNPPRIVGAGARHYRLWDNGSPAFGGQWHYDLDGARRRARYCLESEYAGRIVFLENALRSVERDLHLARSVKPRFRVPAGWERV